MARQTSGPNVVFVSFGSVIHNTMAQLIELGHGLEASGRPFIWVVKELEAEDWIAELEKRVEGIGIVIKGWAPQAVILEHVAVGGFVTHCGWNSTLEALAMGVVMGTWPRHYDQFLNGQLVVEVLKVGVLVSVEEPKMFGVENGNEVVIVSREEVESFVERLMGGGEEEEGEGARREGEDSHGGKWVFLEGIAGCNQLCIS